MLMLVSLTATAEAKPNKTKSKSEKTKFAMVQKKSSKNKDKSPKKDKSTKKDKSYASGYFGYSSGGLALSGDYSMKLDKVADWGAYGSFYSSSSDGAGGFAAGAFIKPKVKRKKYTLYLKGGFGVASLSLPDDSSAIGLGPVLAVGAKRSLSKNLSVGLESQSYYAWFSSPTGLVMHGALASISYKL